MPSRGKVWFFSAMLLMACQATRAPDHDVAVAGATQGLSAAGPFFLPQAGYGLAPGIQSSPRIVFAPSAGEYLAVWLDTRAKPGGVDVFAARIADGGVLDPVGIQLTDDALTQGAPSVASNGTGFFVVWGQPGSATLDIYGARVAADGTVLDPGGFPVIQTSNVDEVFPTVTFDGTNYVVVARGNSGFLSRLQATRVTQTGVVLDAVPQSIAFRPGIAGAPVVAGVSSTLVFHGTFDGGPPTIVAFHVNPTLSHVESTPLVVDAVATGELSGLDAQQLPATQDHLAVWHRSSLDGGSEVVAARLNLGALMPPGQLVMSATPALADTAPRVTTVNIGAFSVWCRGGGDIQGARLGMSLLPFVLESVPIANSPATECGADIASDGTSAVVVNDSLLGPVGDVWLRPWSFVNGGLGAAVPLTTSVRAQRAVAATSAGAGVLFTAYTEERGDGTDAVQVKVMSAGSGAFLGGLTLVSGVTATDELSAVSDGNNVLVIWGQVVNGDRDLRGALVSASGGNVVVSERTLVGTTNQEDSFVAFFDGQSYVVAWLDRPTAGPPMARLARVNPVTLAVSPSQIAAAGAAGSLSACGAPGGGLVTYLVGGQLFGARFVSNGTGVDAGASISLAGGLIGEPKMACAFDGTASSALVTWTLGGQVYSSRLAVSGMTLTALDGGPFQPTYGGGGHALADVTWNGTNWLVGWWQTVDAGVSALATGRVDLAGVPLDGAGRAFAPTGENPTQLTLTAGPLDVFATGVAYDPSPATLSTRAFAVVISERRLGAPCVANAQCDSLHCVDGVCCDTACGGGLTDCVACSVAAGAPVDGTCAPGPAIPCVASCPSGTVPLPGVCAGGLCSGAVCVVPTDGGADDAGYDASVPFDGGGDGGGLDASAPDAGAADAGPLDAGAEDAGGPDAAVDRDGGDSPDAASGGDDAGPRQPRQLTVGCGCSGVGAPSWVLFTSLFVWALRRRRA